MKIENVAVISLEEYEEFAKWKQLKDMPVIDYDRLRTGSVVMINLTGQHCNGIYDFDISKPVDIVFYKTKHRINKNNEFDIIGVYASYVTFHQEGKFCLFSAMENVNYITEVISY